MRNMLLIALAGAPLVAHPTMSAPIDISSPFHFRDIRSNNSAGVTPGDRLAFGANFVTPNPRTGDAGTVVTATQGATTVVVPYLDSPASPAEYFSSVAFNPARTGAWTLTVTNANSANSPVSIVTPTVLRTDGSIAGNPEFVRNMSLSGSGTDLTFSFAAPPGSAHDRVAIRIFDLERRNASGNATLVFVRSGLPAATTSFTLPTILNAEGDTLRTGGRYSVSIELDERRSDGSLLSRSRSFFDFTPLPAGAPPSVFLPTIAPSGAYEFNVDVVGGVPVFIDPFVAIGYDYAIGAGDPNFASVLLPFVGDGLFDLFLFDGLAWQFDQVLSAGITYFFAPGGVSQFRIAGIEPSAGLDPADVTAFVTGVSFVSDGRFTGTMTPITIFVPEAVPTPGSLALLASGLLGLCVARRHRAVAARS